MNKGVIELVDINQIGCHNLTIKNAPEPCVIVGHLKHGKGGMVLGTTRYSN